MVLGLLLCFLSLEALFRIQDKILWQQWQQEAETGLKEVDYKLLNMLAYIQSVALPLFYGLYCFIADKKFGMTRLSISLWTLLLAANWALYLIRFDFDSVFYYPIVILMLVLQLQNRKLLE